MASKTVIFLKYMPYLSTSVDDFIIKCYINVFQFRPTLEEVKRELSDDFRKNVHTLPLNPQSVAQKLTVLR